MPNLSLLARLLQEAELIGLRHRRIDAMQLVEIDAVEPQAAEAPVELFAKTLRPCIRNPLTRTWTIESAFRGDHEISRIRMQRFRDQLFADVRSVRLSGVDEIHAELDRPAKNGEAFLAIFRRTPDAVAG